MKRIVVILLAMAILVTCAAPAFAAGDLNGAMDKIYKAVLNWDERVNIEQFNVQNQDISTALSEMYARPEFFYLNYFEISYNPVSQKVIYIDITYYDEFSWADQDRLDTKISKILSQYILPGMNDVEKVLVLHDYIAVNTSYDEERLEANDADHVSNTAYGALVNGRATCQGYAMAYQLLLENCGIEVKYVRSENMRHGWVRVKINGQWYHVDPTWDDPTPDTLGMVTHNFVLLSDEAMATGKNKHYNWFSDVECTSTIYDSGQFWEEAISQIVFTDSDTAWYLKRGGIGASQYISLVKRSWAKKTETEVARLKAVWHAWGQPDRYWSGTYSGLSIYNGKLYFNSHDTIYMYDPARGVCEEAARYTIELGYLYGLKAREDDILILVRKAPTEAGKVYKYYPPQITETAGVGKEIRDPSAGIPFTDVTKDDYFYDAVTWAYVNKIANGTSETEFSPMATCTRGQVITFIWRAYGCRKPTSDFSIADVKKSAYCYEAICWAIENGITTGTGKDVESGKMLFSPNDLCSYAHILTFLRRAAAGNIAPAANGAWYEETFGWANSSGVIEKIGDRLNSEEGLADNCPRCDAITFLWVIQGYAKGK